MIQQGSQQQHLVVGLVQQQQQQQHLLVWCV
jgi:hypothetical protein